ncbi:peptidoglycan DD-metalloendopeptidase family protein [Salinithrix halophila]|uniref:Peptidoglycan DD-metalloendopeptidase family protein n=1 Tax=Salinithrix halophila TaxID=1485204 RepID=A0ABV8JG27_9BACL
MPKKRTVVASSLSLCTASLFMGGEAQAAYTGEWNQTKTPDWEKEQVAREGFVQYLNPISSVTQGNLAVKTKKKPLLYEVKKGDTLYGIGRRYGVKGSTIAKYNRIQNPAFLPIGQKLKIPVELKRIRVKERQTLYSIARKHKVTVASLKQVNPDLQLTGALYVGQVLIVPRSFEPEASHPETGPSRQGNPGKGGIRLASSSRGTKTEVRSSSFRWPARGQITSNYGWRNGKMHTGIDIWNNRREQNVIKASLGGTVVKAGYSGSYGNLVVIDHGDGWSTYYAHLSRISVAKGQNVNRGGALGNMGTTGNSTGVHLHFEVRRHDRPLHPLTVLP